MTRRCIEVSPDSCGSSITKVMLAVPVPKIQCCRLEMSREIGSFSFHLFCVKSLLFSLDWTGEILLGQAGVNVKIALLKFVDRVVGGRNDCATAEMICRDGWGHNFSGKTSLAETSALIAGADLLVSGDSGLLHIGVALGIPTVSFFVPGIAQKWAPRGEQHSVLNLQTFLLPLYALRDHSSLCKPTEMFVGYQC